MGKLASALANPAAPSGPRSFHELATPAQERAWRELEDALQVAEPRSNEQAWRALLGDLDRYAEGPLKGLIYRAKKIGKPAALRMLEVDLATNSVAAAFVAHRAGLLDFSAPLLAWAAFLWSEGLVAGEELALMRYLIWAGAKDWPDEEGWTALLILANRRDADLPIDRAIRSVLDAGSEVMARTPRGNTALHMVCASCLHSESGEPAARLLWERGADWEAENDDKETPRSELVKVAEAFAAEDALLWTAERRRLSELVSGLIADYQQGDLDSLLRVPPPSSSKRHWGRS